MSGPSTYVPGNGFERWLDQRLPILRMAHDSFIAFPTPRNLNYWYTFGGILSFALVVQIVTGIVLAMHYVPNIGGAFASVQRIERDVPFGWLVQNIHSVGASMFFLAVYIHMLRGLYYGSYKAPREILWILGVVIYLLMMATAFMGYVLPWGQMSFWGATVITNLFSAIPLVGEPIKLWLLGGFATDNATLNRFFSLHYLLPFMIAGCVALHIWALHVPGNNNPLGVDVKSSADTLPFHPYYTVKDAFAMAVFVLLFAAFVFYAPDSLGHPDNLIPANPLVTPAEIVPEWYLLPFYAILRAIPDKLGGVLAMFGSIGVLFILPWIDTSKVRSMRFRPFARWAFVVFVGVCLALGWCGGQLPDKPVFQSGRYVQTFEYRTATGGTAQGSVSAASATELERLAHAEEARVGSAMISMHSAIAPFQFKVVQLSQVLTLYYFGFFLILLPLLGLIERPGRVPDTIAKAVLKDAATERSA